VYEMHRASVDSKAKEAKLTQRVGNINEGMNRIAKGSEVLLKRVSMSQWKTLYLQLQLQYFLFLSLPAN